MAPEVVLSGPRCNKFLSKLFEFLVFFCRIKYICHQNTLKLYLLFLLWAYHPKTCEQTLKKYVNFLDLVYIHTCSALATLRATIGLIIISCYPIKVIKIKGFVTSQKCLWPAINFLMLSPTKSHSIISLANQSCCHRPNLIRS